MPNPTYSAKLKDPRWQRKRLEVMSRDNFSCTDCGTTTETLNVHHISYVYGMEPWEYPVEMLTTLCKPCHAAGHGLREWNDGLVPPTCTICGGQVLNVHGFGFGNGQFRCGPCVEGQVISQ